MSVDFTQSVTATNPLELTYAYADSSPGVFQPGGSNLASAAAGPTTLVSPPAAGLSRQVKYLSVFNADTVANTFTFFQRVGTFRSTLRRVVLQTLETLVWDGMRWASFNAAGAEKMDQGVGAAPVIPHLFAPDSQAVGMSPLLHILPSSAVISATAYWVYQGFTAQAITVKFIEAIVASVAGTGAQTAEVAIASSPAAPNKAASQSLTKIAATGTVDSLLVANTLIRNTASLSAVVPASTHLWAGIRIAMATTQPQMQGLTADWNQGHILTTAGAGVLTGAGPFTGSRLVMAIPYAWQVPALRTSEN